MTVYRGSKGPAAYETWASEEKLELESLVLANQAATADFRKLTSKRSLNKIGGLEKDKIARFGIIGQLSPRTEPDQGSNSTSTDKPDSKRVSPHSMIASLRGRSKSFEGPGPGIEVMPPALSYNSSGGIAPYRTIANPPAGNAQQPVGTTPGATRTEASKQSPAAHRSTPGAVVDMLLARMVTQDGQRTDRPRPE
jgi:hypothetical protein